MLCQPVRPEEERALDVSSSSPHFWVRSLRLYLPAIRPIKSFLEDAEPTFIGTLSLGMDPFYTEPDLARREEKVKANATLSLQEGKRWSLGFYLDPTWGGKGIMTVSLSVHPLACARST